VKELFLLVLDTTILLSSFKQPEWVEIGNTTPLNLSLVKSTSFSIASNAVEGKLIIYEATPSGIVVPERKTPVKLDKKSFVAKGAGTSDQITVTINAPDNFSGVLTDTIFVYHNAPETPSPILVPVKVSVNPVSIHGKSQQPRLPGFTAFPTIAVKQIDDGITFHLQLPEEGRATVMVYDCVGNIMWSETVASASKESVIGPWPLTAISGRSAASGVYRAIATFTNKNGKNMSSQIMIGIKQ